MSARPSSDMSPRSWQIAIVGNDMLLAALPGRAVQLAHAVLAAGYDLVVPVSWGEELLAEHALRELERAPSHAMVFCACPLARQRLLSSGNEIVPHLLSTVAPPVATARYLRGLQPDVPMRITFLGGCAGAGDESIDAQQTPAEFLQHLEQRGIAIARQPLVFESTVPPDRRRHWSVPGGAPSPESLAALGIAARFVSVSAEVALDIADAILSAERVLLDIAPTQGCACAGAIEVHAVEGNREAVIALEPPRSHLPVIDVEPRVPVAHVLPHLTGQGVSRTMRTPPSTRATSMQVTSIQDAARGRAERRRLAVTPAHIGATESRGRPGATTRPPTPAQLAARRSELPQRPAKDSDPTPEDAGSEPTAIAPPHVPEPPVAVSVEISVASEVIVEALPSPEAPGPDTASEEPVVASRRRTPAYEMRQAARARSSHPGEAPRIPRAYGAVRSRTRSGEVPAIDAAPRDDAPLSNRPLAHIATPAAPDASTAIPVVVDTPAPRRHTTEDRGPRPAIAPHIDRNRDEPSRRRPWIVGIVVALATAAVMYVLLGS